jgi:hypothetical protein
VFLIKTFLTDGNWGEWSSFSGCSKVCGTGNHVRTRACNSPYPYGGGHQCQGDSVQTEACIIKPCPAGVYFILFFSIISILEPKKQHMNIHLTMNVNFIV